jgi:hypothetical protein
MRIKSEVKEAAKNEILVSFIKALGLLHFRQPF